jgi:ABC-type sugar transport system substrate-binding protein
MLAYDYPLLGLFWTMLWFFLLVAWIMLLFHITVDIFRSDDLGGFSKALWVTFVIVLPYLGAFVYLIARGQKMAHREVAAAQANDAAMKNYIREAAGETSSAAQIEQLADLRARGVISDAEFEAGKAKALS